MRFGLVIVLLFSFISSDLYAASLCMGPMPGQDEELPTMPIMSDSDLYIPPTATLEIQIANKGMKISVGKGGVIKELEENKKHLVKVIYDGKIFQSFWMDFKEHGTSDLCLWYYQGYGTLSLLNSREKRCNCDNTL